MSRDAGQHFHITVREVIGQADERLDAGHHLNRAGHGVAQQRYRVNLEHDPRPFKLLRGESRRRPAVLYFREARLADPDEVGDHLLGEAASHPSPPQRLSQHPVPRVLIAHAIDGREICLTTYLYGDSLIARTIDKTSNR